MIRLVQTETYRKWEHELRDQRARALIAARLLQRRGEEIVILLCGGNKSTQGRDIEKAKRLAAEWKTLE